MPRQSGVFFFRVAIVKSSNITNIVAHVVLRVTPSAIRSVVGQLDNNKWDEWMSLCCFVRQIWIGHRIPIVVGYGHVL
jgi:hypothetical protein